MKIQLQLMNVNEAVVKDDFKPVTISDMQAIEDASCSNIRVGQTLDFIKERDSLLNLIISKLKYGGKLSIEGVDLVALAESIIYGHVNSQDVDKLLYHTNRCSITSFYDICQDLQNKNIKIKSKRFEGYFFIVEAERPKPNDKN